MLGHLYTLPQHTIKSRYVLADDTQISLTKLCLISHLQIKKLHTLQGDDSTAEKITGSIVNAAIFVAVIALMTFVLVLLFKYGVNS